jgi:hypothetical protein
MLKVDVPNLSLVNDLSAAITLADTGNVDTIFVAGRLVKASGRLLSHDMRSVQDRAWRSRDRLLPGLTIHGAKELLAAIPS